MTLKVSVFGVGVVGAHVLKRLQKLRQERDIEVVGVFSRTYKPEFANVEWFGNWPSLVGKSDMVVECMGGVSTAKDIVFEALNSKKKVVSSNKHLIATCGADILPKFCDTFWFEASVCAAIPIIKLLKEYYANDQILQISGILNGTSNYILSKISNSSMSFEEALKLAQHLGIAESDPTFDVDGIDAAHKAIITHYLAFKKWVKIDDVCIEKPRNAVSGQKSIATITDGKIEVRNSSTKTFSRVHGCYNAVEIVAKTTGNTFISGIGAGGEETAFAIVSDILSGCA